MKNCVAAGPRLGPPHNLMRKNAGNEAQLPEQKPMKEIERGEGPEEARLQARAPSPKKRPGMWCTRCCAASTAISVTMAESTSMRPPGRRRQGDTRCRAKAPRRRARPGRCCHRQDAGPDEERKQQAGERSEERHDARMTAGEKRDGRADERQHGEQRQDRERSQCVHGRLLQRRIAASATTAAARMRR